MNVPRLLFSVFAAAAVAAPAAWSWPGLNQLTNFANSYGNGGGYGSNWNNVYSGGATAYGNGYGNAYGNGYGNAYGNGYGNAYGNGYGSAYGNGYGNNSFGRGGRCHGRGGWGGFGDNDGDDRRGNGWGNGWGNGNGRRHHHHQEQD